MKLVSSGDIWRIFLEADPDTIIRRPNLRRFARDNGVEHYIYEKGWLINQEQFFQKINPKNLSLRESMPRMRSIASSVREWDGCHKRVKIDKHIVEICMQNNSVFKLHRGNIWLINYDQLEVVIKEFMRENEYIPMEKRLKNKKYGFKGRKRHP